MNRFANRAKLLRAVTEFFKGDEKKARLWFETPNPLLGDLSPNDLIAIGRFDTVRRFVADALDLNRSG